MGIKDYPTEAQLEAAHRRGGKMVGRLKALKNAGVPSSALVQDADTETVNNELAERLDRLRRRGMEHIG